MPGFRFSAMNPKGRIIRGAMDASGVDDLESRLLRMQLDLIRCTEVQAQSTKIAANRITRQEMITLCFHLEQVMGSGVPLVEGLSDLRDSSENPVMQALVAELIEEVQSGTTLSLAMARFPQVFDEVFTALIRAGEESGRLQEIFVNLAETIKWQDELASKTKKMLMYPAFVLTIVAGVFFFMMTFLVPQLVTFIKMMGMELPFHTRLLIDTSDFIVAHWPLIIATPLLLTVLLVVGVRVSPLLAYWVDFVKLRIWVFGPIRQKIVMARFANVFAMMYAAGITVLNCLVISEKVVGNLVLERVMKEVQEKIGEGETITASFKRTMIFPPLVLRMLQVGEGTGSLDKSLLNVRYFYDREVKDSVDRLQGMVEPVLTLLLGLLMAWIILSVLGAIYDIMNQVGR